MIPQLLEQFQRKGTSCSFVAVDGRREENQIRAEHVPDERQRNSSCLVNDEQFSVAQFRVIRRTDVLNCLAAGAENVDTNKGFIVFHVRRLNQTVVDMLFVAQSVKPAREKFYFVI